MRRAVREKLDRCTRMFDDGTLTRSDLELLEAELGHAPPRRQDLLFLQTRDSGVESRITGISRVVDGAVVRVDRATTIYDTVLDAIRDGWRVISFPNLVLVLDEHNPQGMGCEFILEKWSDT